MKQSTKKTFSSNFHRFQRNYKRINFCVDKLFCKKKKTQNKMGNIHTVGPNEALIVSGKNII